MKRFILISVLLTVVVPAFAQQSKPNKNTVVTDVIREMLPRQSKNLIAAVDEMPSDKFNFRPTPPQMTFAHLVMHITESNNYLCAKAGDVPAPKVPDLAETDGKDKLLAALKASFDFCTVALAKIDDSKLGDTVDLFGGRQGPRAFALIALTNDWADHYAAAAQYLRLKGLLPPTAKK
jgi:DinB superfamily